MSPSTEKGSLAERDGNKCQPFAERAASRCPIEILANTARYWFGFYKEKKQMDTHMLLKGKYAIKGDRGTSLPVERCACL